MEEVISIHIGQAGCQSGQAQWELLCAEHDINLNGNENVEFYFYVNLLVSISVELLHRNYNL